MNGIVERVGKDRGDIPWTESCLDPELVKHVKKFETENKPILCKLFEKHKDKKIITLHTREEADELINDLMKAE